MEKTIEFYSNSKNIIIYKHKKYFYELYSGKIEERCQIEFLLNDESLLKELIISGFDCYQKEYWGYEKRFFPNGNYIIDSKYKNFYIPISKNFIEFYSLNWTKEKSYNQEYITLSNIHLNEKNIESFYEFLLEIDFEVFTSGFQRSIAFKDSIYIEMPNDENLKSQMALFFGKPQNIPELDNEKYGSGKNYFYYIVPKSKINKIIGIKKYRDTSTFGQPDGEQFTGEQEKIILDLHNFDENIYKIFEEHKMLKIENIE